MDWICATWTGVAMASHCSLCMAWPRPPTGTTLWPSTCGTVITSSHPTSGATGETTQAPSGYDWHTLSDDLAALLDHVGNEIPGFREPVPALGHSWGGHVVSNLAYHYPERVRRIVMIDGGFLDGRLFPEPTWEAFSDRLRPRNVTGDRQEFLNRLREQMAGFWNGEIERIVQTMVYEDEDGQIQDILRPENQGQVIRAMWDDPCSHTLTQVQCPALIIAAGPVPERANSDFAQLRLRMVGAAEAALPNGRAHWIPETVHDIGYHKPEELGAGNPGVPGRIGLGW